MKNVDLFVLAESLKANLESLKQLQGTKFTYSVIKNIDILEKEIKVISEIIKPSEKYSEYETKRTNLCAVFGKKDADGNLVYKQTENGQEYDIDVTDEKWIKAIDELKEEYKDSIDERTKQIDNYNQFLDKESDVEFHKIHIDEIPENVTLEHMLLLKYFISEE